MGSLGSRILRHTESEIAEPREPEPQAGPSYASGSRKRRQSSRHSLGQESENSSSMSRDQEEYLQVVSTSHGKKVKITSEHAYQTLFLNAETSDIKIRALGKLWCLHKMFLCQSRYFATMFRGSWKESHKDIIDLDINDPNIDAESLHFVLGSLYRDEYVLSEPLQVPRVLATARLLQVGDLIRQCDETMKKMINVKTVCSYYAAAETYALDSVKTGCFEWLLHNLMTHPSVELYKDLSVELMNLLISSSNLFVMQKEIDVYTTLKKWMFLRLNPAWEGSTEQLLIHANNWFSRHRESAGDTAFLETKQGITFQSVFKKLRFQHMICDLASTRVIEQDTLIPSEWLSDVYKQQWFALLRTQQSRKTGPQVINETELEEYSMRCGRKIAKNGEYCWKWSGYNFGFPLHVIFTSHYIIFKQSTYNYSCDSSQSQRNIAFRLTLVCFDSSGKVSFSKTTGYKILTFAKDEEQMVMKLDGLALSFPLYVFCNFLFISSENPGN
ncbi:PREDICTED: putative germ cell-less protein-like 1-like [Hipposideros armiger]|uniref:Germ cell-less protein-like 1-like n=1 Tax=Hipposideros armiger TaxID=186990 RepID=A0A8B7QPD0_HIPAR|nr:PREDICTED: putative germ cell-less protein-like 1-like [Hipposideros armiger]